MKKIKYITFLILLLSFYKVSSQSVEVFGKVESKVDVENVHVINKTAKLFTATNKNGAFKMIVKLNDTLLFSSIQHASKEVVINNNVILSKSLIIKLDEQINELDEVVVGKVLTGDLLSDINNIEGDPPINFYNVGIPGYKGKKATQSERRLHEATTGGGIIPLNPILNAISGRTKMLKNRIKLEENIALRKKIETRLAKSFFSIHELDKNRHADFFYFCEEDESFSKRCKGKSDIEIIKFMEEKLIAYKKNMKTKE